MSLFFKPLRKRRRSPLEADVSAEPDAGNPLLFWCTAAGAVPDPRFGHIPPCGQLRGINQFRAIPATIGHQWDICHF